MTSLAPTKGAEKSRPQQLAWKAGTTASTVVALVMAEASGIDTVNAWRKFALCEYSTPCLRTRGGCFPIAQGAVSPPATLAADWGSARYCDNCHRRLSGFGSKNADHKQMSCTLNVSSARQGALHCWQSEILLYIAIFHVYDCWEGRSMYRNNIQRRQSLAGVK